MKALLVLFTCFMLFATSVTAHQIEAVSGVISLKRATIDPKAKVKLNGEWEFYEGRFLLSDSLYAYKTTPIYASVPLAWNKIQGTSGLRDGIGYGSYALKLIREKGAKHALLVKDVGSAYRIWVNGELLGEVGQIGKERSASKPSFGTLNIGLPDEEELSLIIEVANFHQSKGGLKSYLAYSGSNPKVVEEGINEEFYRQ
ncbi:MAG: hypothetical protein ACK417_08305 [Bacteroidia bacterium]